MIELGRRITAFSKLGEWFRIKSSDFPDNTDTSFRNILEETSNLNPWFMKRNILAALSNHGLSLTEQNLERWTDKYKRRLFRNVTPKRVGVVMAGNIPMVGFHDFLCVLLSGNKLAAKLSSDDNKLLPAVAAQLVKFEPEFKSYFEFTENRLEQFEAVIATGSNNTSRYFEYYFRNIPHVIRKNRNGIAVLCGNETQTELEGLGEDIFEYFGLGCRSVSKVFVPEDYNFKTMLNVFGKFKYITNHSKYYNNYDYYKSIFLINGNKHYDNGFLLIKESKGYSSPPAVVYFEKYSGLSGLIQKLQMDKEQIQCIVSKSNEIAERIPFGHAQKPELWDYADGVDTMEFLLSL